MLTLDSVVGVLVALWVSKLCHFDKFERQSFGLALGDSAVGVLAHIQLLRSDHLLDVRASGNTALSSPCWDLLALMRRVVNYHSSWVVQRQVELFDASGIRVWCKYERIIPVCLYTHQWPPFIAGFPGYSAGLGVGPAGGAPGGG
ncbi:hypothetical protein F511_21952 [Dorcoceras hygrometricum]|uniref:Uncharacterized protein n=1 Tax=Dorcoceras hygrometricum TaxID=472368 RepID=A0A2Z7BAG3_9LAMI|nr:hypothetical protein F511_21952 [Dorcoceras hygrometricum]